VLSDEDFSFFPRKRRRPMIFYRFSPLFLALVALLTITGAAFALPQPLALRIFHSSNLHGEISPCG